MLYNMSKGADALCPPLGVGPPIIGYP